MKPHPRYLGLVPALDLNVHVHVVKAPTFLMQITCFQTLYYSVACVKLAPTKKKTARLALTTILEPVLKNLENITKVYEDQSCKI